MAALSPAQLLERGSPFYCRVGEKVADMQLETREGPKGLSVASKRFGAAGLHFLGTCVLLDEPRRWQDDPRQPLHVLLCSEDLCDWLTKEIEPWLQNAARWKEEFHSCVRVNSWGERSCRAKISAMTRFYDADDARLETAPPLERGARCTALICANIYKLNGQYGLSIRLNSIQPRWPAEPEAPVETPPTKKQRT